MKQQIVRCTVWPRKREEMVLCLLLLILVLALPVRHCIWMPILITGNSMLPNLHRGQIKFVHKLAYLRQSPHRGDIVAVWTGKDLIIKRVVGLPGEIISANGGAFWINGSALSEPYVQLHDCWKVAPGRMSSNQFVVAGDNRPQTLIAVVKRERIVGKVVP